MDVPVTVDGDQDRSPVITGNGGPALPAGRSRIGRISQHGKGLVSDLTSWVELKMKLVQVEIEEKLDERINKLISTAIVAGIALLGVVFLLIALGLGSAAIFIALGLSAPLSYFLGFLLITVILFLAAWILQSMRPHLVDIGSKEAEVEQSKLVPGIEPRTALTKSETP